MADARQNEADLGAQVEVVHFSFLSTPRKGVRLDADLPTPGHFRKAKPSQVGGFGATAGHTDGKSLKAMSALIGKRKKAAATRTLNL